MGFFSFCHCHKKKQKSLDTKMLPRARLTPARLFVVPPRKQPINYSTFVSLFGICNPEPQIKRICNPSRDLLGGEQHSLDFYNSIRLSKPFFSRKGAKEDTKSAKGEIRATFFGFSLRLKGLKGIPWRLCENGCWFLRKDEKAISIDKEMSK
jgi:hypothetical protein